MKNNLYLCCPLLNTECSKEICYINGGECFKTIKEKYSQEHLLDYITNLQKEKDYYFKKNNELSTLNTSLRNDRDIYKIRNEEAIEIIKDAGCYDEEMKQFCDDIWEELPDLLNVLQGKSDE